MIEHRPFNGLGGEDHGWLKAKHHFSFADYVDSARNGLGLAARLEQLHIAPNAGFPPPAQGIMMTVDASRHPPQSRHTQAPKHQVCDHCGGRFGLVTHRWWGNKFCKKVCKDAYVHEIVLDRDTICRWFGFTRAPHRAHAVE
ncbi:MAG: hypothetical protein WAV38_38630 [Xanthobacteraceae bacterium]